MKKLIVAAVLFLSLVAGTGQASADPGKGDAFTSAGVTWEGAGLSISLGVTWE